MQKFKLVGLVVICVSLGLLGSLCIINNKSNETYEDISLKENSKLLSMMLETEAGSGKYQETTASSWPTDGYTFNENLSKCENGGTLSWDSTNKNVLMEGNSSDKCYVYFDVARYDQICDETLLACHVAKQYNGTQGGNNLYLHDSTLENGANDGSYRYAGSSETTNNFVCFGYDSTNGTCSTEYLYRIIGVFNNQVKLIKYDYISDDLLGTEGNDGNVFLKDNYLTYIGTLSSVRIYIFNESTQNNLWSNNKLNTLNLNQNFLNNIGTKWANMIDNHEWSIKGGLGANIRDVSINDCYKNEVSSSIIYNAKVGLVYVSDYGYATLPKYWTTHLYSYQNGTQKDNWLFMGMPEWTITSKTDDNLLYTFILGGDGDIYYAPVNYYLALRPSFYLKSEITYVSGAGTMSSPFILS